MDYITSFFHAFNPTEPGYIFMWTLLVSGVFCAAIAIERTLFLQSRSSRKTDPLMRKIVDCIAKGDMDGAKNICSGSGKLALTQIIHKILKEHRSGTEHINNLVDESILKVVPELEKRTGYLATIGNVATLIGLMGTIYGLIISFSAVGKPGIDAAEKSTLLASGIAAAMSTTFMGLLVAIPSIILYSLLKSKTQQIIDDIDMNTLRLVNTLNERFNSGSSGGTGGEAVNLQVTGSGIRVFANNRLIGGNNS